MSRFCTSCGSPLMEGQRFCSSCGSPVAVMPATDPEPVPAADELGPKLEPEDYDVPEESFEETEPDDAFYEEDEPDDPDEDDAPEQPMYSAPAAGYSPSQQPSYPASEPPAYSAPQQPAYSAPQQPAYTAPQQTGYAAPQQPGYQQPAYSPEVPQPVKSRKASVIIGVVIVVMAIALGAIYFFGGQNKDLPEELRFIVGDWEGVYVMIGDDEIDLTNVSAPMKLYSDGAGHIDVSGSTFDFTYTFDEIDSDGDYAFDVKLGGDSGRFWYYTEYEMIEFAMSDDIRIIFEKD